MKPAFAEPQNDSCQGSFADRVSLSIHGTRAVRFEQVCFNRIATMNQVPRKRSMSGFTMVELATVMSIVAILLAIGVPSYRYVTTANRMSSDINALLGDLLFARAEAIKEGQTITVCATTDGATCTTSGVAWQGGWLVFTDTNGNKTVDTASETILRVQKPLPNLDTLQADHAIRAIMFNRSGFVAGLPLGGTLTLHDSTSNAQYTRCLSFTIIGAMSTQKAGAQTAEGAACT
jgi:type IV fimbrial biogenesis protein FimT